MLKRKITKYLEDYFASQTDKILIIEGARQIGKSFAIRETGERMFKNYIEINFVRDDEGDKIFADVRSTNDFYMALSSVYGKMLGDRNDTLVFIDEIQHYPQYLTLLKFLREESKFRYVASGSLLGLTLKTTTSVPVGSVILKRMHQLDFEEFLWAAGCGEEAIEGFRSAFYSKESLNEGMHNLLMKNFRYYLLVGGLPDAVNEFIASKNIAKIREVQADIQKMYLSDASQYEADAGRSLVIRKIYRMVVSQMENKKKRIVATEIEKERKGRHEDYAEEFEYLTSSGICNEVSAITNPKFPLAESVSKNLLKLYLNDVGLLTAQLYRNNIQAVMQDVASINLGSVYETVVAQELSAHCGKMFYYDNRKNGEVDFLIDDFDSLSVLPIEVKSGKDYYIHNAIDKLLKVADYNVKYGVVLSNEREIKTKNGIVYMPVYFSMFLGQEQSAGDVILD